MCECYSGWCLARHRIIAPHSFAANSKTCPMIYTKGYLGLDRYDSEQSRTEQHAGCILKRILVWLMDPFLCSVWGQAAASHERRWRAGASRNRNRAREQKGRVARDMENEEQARWKRRGANWQRGIVRKTKQGTFQRVKVIYIISGW